jgi:hypothetical protein
VKLCEPRPQAALDGAGIPGLVRPNHANRWAQRRS